MVRAKFKVAEVRQVSVSTSKQDPETGKWVPHEDVQEVVRLTVAQGPGNESWSKWTPSGSIEMAITNPEAVAALKLGQHYFVDFTPATEVGETR